MTTQVLEYLQQAVGNSEKVLWKPEYTWISVAPGETPWAPSVERQSDSNQTLEMSRVKANKEKHNEGQSTSVSSRQLRERNYMWWAKGTAVLSLFSCKRTRPVKWKMSFNRSHTLSHGMTALRELWPWRQCWKLSSWSSWQADQEQDWRRRANQRPDSEWPNTQIQ